MEFTCTKKQIIVVLSLLAAVLVGWAVKHVFFAPLDDKYFRLDYQQLQAQTPANLFVFRPTKFEESRRAGVMAAYPRQSGGRYVPGNERLLGRNATLDQIMALAYQCQRSRVVLPADAAKEGYDFLVTKTNAHQLLQKAVKKKLGYVANWKERETEVLELKVRPGGATGFHPSTDDSNRGTEFKDGKLYFRNAQVQWITGMLESAFNLPLTDKTGLKGNYDFSISWDWRGRGAGPDIEALKRSLAELGLAVVTNTASMQMLVVEKK